MIEPTEEDIEKRVKSFLALKEQAQGFYRKGIDEFIWHIAEAYEYQRALAEFYKKQLYQR